MKTLLIPVDFSENAEQLVHAAIGHFDEMPLDIVLVHAYRLPQKPTELVRQALTHCLGHDSLRQLNQLKAAIMDRYKMFPSLRIRTISQFGLAQQVVEDHARSICPDFIVLAESNRSRLWPRISKPLAARLANRVEVPLLTLPLRSMQDASMRFVTSTGNITS